MERHRCGETRVIPIILRPCDWQSAPFGKLKALPTDSKPVTKHQTLDDAFLDITRAIREVIQQLGPAPPVVEHIDPRLETRRSLHSASECGIWLGGSASILNGILFSHSGLGNGNSYNESLSIEDDGFSLFLKPLGMARMAGNSDKALTPEGAAEYYWGLLVERLQ